MHSTPTLFSYSLNSQCNGCESAFIHNDGTVSFYWDEETFVLHEEALEKVKSIVSDNRIYDIQEIETNDENFYSSYQYEFVFNDGSRQKELKGEELEICLKNPDRYPTAIFLLDILQQIREICSAEGVPDHYFMPADPDQAIPFKRVHYTQLTVYNFREPDASKITIGHKEWLEHYIFRKIQESGKVEVDVQIGWNAGSHNDGGARIETIPKKWLTGSWESFINHLTTLLPKKEYGLGKDELQEREDLKEFLGFGKRD